MQHNIKDIDLINAYLFGSLTAQQKTDFETRLKTDVDFKNTYETHVVFLEGLKRQAVKQDIKRGKRLYVRNKWFKVFGIPLILFVVLFFIFLISTNNKGKLAFSQKLNFESEYVQYFNIPLDSVIEITGKKGTKIRFNPNHLKTNSNESFIADSLRVELIELTTKQDLLLANAQTISNGEWLISGGAFKINISANGLPLNLNEGKTIRVQFPKNTSEKNMQLFYGERDDLNIMNWLPTNIQLEPETYFTIFYKDSIVLDVEQAKRFGVDMYNRLAIADSLGYLDYTDITLKFPELDSLIVEKDTLRVFYNTFELFSGYFPNSDFPPSEYFSISREQANFLIKPGPDYYVDYYFDKGFFETYNTITNDFYKALEISNLGWINIDKFAPKEEKVNIQLSFNLRTKYNEIYLIDERNSTVLNVLDEEIEIPKGRSFCLIAIGMKGDAYYVFKKSVRFKTNTDYKINYKEIKANQLKSMLKIDVDPPQNKPIKKKETEVENDFISVEEKVVEDEIENTEIQTKPVVDSVITEFFKKVFKTPNRFEITSNKDTTIVCSEGTKLFIKANSFIDENAIEVKGKMHLFVSEYYKISDMLLADLTTTSYTEILETGGMLFIEAKKENSKLKLKEQSAIEISFPTKKPKNDMQLFSGFWNNDRINWELQYDTASLPAETAKINFEKQEPRVEVPYAVVEQTPIFPDCEKGTRSQQKNCTSTAISKFVRENFNISLASAYGLSGRQRINAIFKINEEGAVSDIRIRAPHPVLKREAERVLSLLPKMIPGKQRGIPVVVPYSLPIIFDVGENISIANIKLLEGMSNQDSVYLESLEKDIVSSKNDVLPKSVVDNYILMTGKLGWINCDRFVRNRNLVKYKLIQGDRGIAKVNVVFKSLNSVLPGRFLNGGYDFGSVPTGEMVVLIAIKKLNGKLYLHMGETIIKENPKIEFKFREVSIDELKKALKKLNKDFK
ncbi:energy transducer TonB [Aestuariibaculum sediminum]|uniref:TonB C-terminal domain-containing protein n=1 Tax=Aestuariibaculum sediminum TaxID=2770637 RepID=A0A8J6Q620_9FLAO|nr:hypothetical protein [Aestuariibaculum sediminum]MBD0831393.1 hypothetical protein [Aestuariibaculum sediminum]